MADFNTSTTQADFAPLNELLDHADAAVFSFQTSGKRKDPSTPWNCQTDFFILDCAITEEHRSAVQITEHPVETGSDITDNARPLPDELTVEGFISNVPKGAYWGFYTNDPNAAVTSEGYQFPAEALDGLASTSRVKVAFDLLRSLKDNSTPVNITTSLKFYPVMLIESLSFPRNSQIGDSLLFTIKFRSVRFVSSEVTTAQVRTVNAQSKVKKGPVAAKVQPQGRQRSFLLKKTNDATNGDFKELRPQFPFNAPE